MHSIGDQIQDFSLLLKKNYINIASLDLNSHQTKIIDKTLEITGIYNEVQNWLSNTDPSQPREQLLIFQKIEEILISVNKKDSDEEILSIIGKIHDFISQASTVFLPSQAPPKKSLLNEIRAHLPDHLRSDAAFREHSRLRTHKQEPIEAQLAAHILGEEFIKDTELEGYTAAKAMESLKNFLLPHKGAHGVAKFIEALERGAQIYQSLDEISNESFLTKRDEFAQSAAVSFETLSPKESIILAAGWPGHTIYLHIQKQENGKFSLRVFNKGEGAEHHLTYFKDGRLFISPFYSLTEIPLENIKNPIFLDSLFEIKTQNSFGKKPSDFFYKGLLPMLEGTISSIETSKFVPPSKSGTCTWAGLMAAMSEMIGEEAALIELDIKIKALLNFYFTYEKEFVNDDLKFSLLKRSIEQIARDLKALSEIEESRIIEIYSTLREMNELVELIAHNKNAQKALESIINYEIESTPSTSQLFLPVVQPYTITSSSLPSSILKLKLDFSKLKGAATVLEGLQSFYEHALTAYEHGSITDQKILRLQMEEFYKALPKPNDSSFWESVQEPQKTVHLLSQIGQIFVKNNVKPGATSSEDDWFKTTVFLFKSLVIQTELLKKDPLYKNYRNGIPRSLFINKLEGSIQGRPSFPHYLFTQDLQEEMEGIKACHPLFLEPESIFLASTVSYLPQTFFNSINKDNLRGSSIEEVLLALTQVAKLKKTDSPLSQISSEDLFVLAIQDLEARIMPETFCDIKMSLLLAKRSLYEREGNTSEALNSPAIKIGKKEKDKQLHFYIEFMPDAPKIKKGSNPRLSKDLSRVVKEGRKSINRNPLKETDIQRGCGTVETLNNKKYEALTDQEAKKLLKLVNTGDLNETTSSYELQPIKTLSFFSSNHGFSLLRYIPYQEFAKFCFLESNYLQKAVIASPEFLEKLNSFLNYGFSFYYNHGEIKTALFFLELIARLNDSLNGELQSAMPKPPLELIRNFLADVNLTEEERALGHEARLVFYANKPLPLQEDEVKDLFSSIIALSINPISVKDNSHYMANAAMKTIMRFSDQLRVYFSTPSGQIFINETLSFYLKKDIDARWNIDKFPTCTSDTGETCFNIIEKTIYNSSQAISRLPRSITLDPRYLRCFPHADFFVKQTGEGSFEFIDDRGFPARIIQNRKKLFIEKNINGSWARYIDKEDSQEIINIFPKGLTTHYTHFLSPEENGICHLYFIDHEGALKFEAKIGMSSTNRLQELREATEALYGPYNLFNLILASKENLSPEGEAGLKFFQLTNTPNANVALSKEEKSLLEKLINKQDLSASEKHYRHYLIRSPYMSELFPSLVGPQSKIIELKKINPNGDLYLQSIANDYSFLKQFKNFEKSQELFLFTNEKGEIKTLEAPRFGLEFTYNVASDGVARFFCRQIPGFYISDIQKTPALPSLNAALILENGKKKKALVPLQPIVDDDKNVSLKSDISLNLDFETSPWRAYDITTSGLKASSRLDKLFLSYILLCEKQYEKSAQIILSLSHKRGNFTEKETEILQWIVFNSGSDYDSRSSPIKLLAFALFIGELEDREEYKDTLELYKQDMLCEILQSYTMGIENRSVTPIDAKHEKDILDLLSGLENASHLLIELRQNQLAGSSKSTNRTQKRKNSSNPQSLTSDDLNISSDIFRDLANKATSPPEPFSWLSLDAAAAFFELYKLAETKPVILRGLLKFAEPRNKDRGIRALLLQKLTYPEKLPSAKEMEIILRKRNFKGYKEVEKIAKSLPFITDKNDTEFTIIFNKTTPEVLKPLETPPLSEPALAAPLLLPSQTSQLFKFQDKEPPLNQEEIDNYKKTLLLDSSPLSKKITDELIEDLEFFINSQNGLQEAIVDQEYLQKIGPHLLIMEAEERKAELFLEEALLALANKIPEKQEHQHGLKIMGGLDAPITLADLYPLIIQRDKGQILKKNPFLSDSDVNTLAAGLLKLLVRATKRQQLTRSLALTEQIQNIFDSKTIAAEEKQQTIKSMSGQLHLELTRERSYKTEVRPEYLIFEFLEDVMLYENQHKDLDRFLEGKEELILQKIMGSGKSRILLPLLAMRIADGENIPFIIVPSSLYGEACDYTPARSDAIFGQKAHFLEIDRQTEMSDPFLKDLLEEMELVRVNRDYFILTSKSIQCLYLHYIELWNKSLKGEVASETVEALGKILNLMKKRGRAILDEADLLLSLKHEVNYSNGTKKPIQKDEGQLIVDLYMSLDEVCERLKISTDFSKQKGEALVIDDYDTKIKPALIDTFINRSDFTKNLPERQKLAVAYYLKNGRHLNDSLNDLDDRFFELLGLCADQLDTYLKTALSKKCGLHHGFRVVGDESFLAQEKNIKGNALTSVPYEGCNRPSKVSEHGHEQILLNCTAQIYLTLGTPKWIIAEVMDEFKSKAIAEMFQQRCTLEETSAYATFKDIVGEEISIQFLNPSEKDIEKIAQTISQDRNKILVFLQKIVFPSISYYPEKSSSDAIMLPELFGRCIGFSGTLPYKLTFNPKLTAQVEKGTDGKTLTLLKQKNSKNFCFIQTSAFPKCIEEMQESNLAGAPMRACIDTGSQFNGIDNLKVAEEFIKVLPSTIKGVLFFQDDQLMILERGSKIPIPRDQSLLNETELFTFYDQWHTTGIDIKQQYNAHAWITVGKDMTFRDLSQGGWRLRMLDKEQRLRIIITPEVAAHVYQIFGIQPQDKFFDPLISLLTLNPVNELQKQITDFCQKRVRSLVRAAIYEKLMSRQVTPKDITENAVNKTFFVDKMERRNGRFPASQVISKEKAVDNYIFSAFSELDELASFIPALHEIDRDKLRNTLLNAILLEFLPDTVQSGSIVADSDLSVEIETEADVEQEVRTEIELETNNQASPFRISSPVQWPWPDRTDLYSSKTYQIRPLQLEFKELPSLNTYTKNGEYYGMHIAEGSGTVPIFSLNDIIKTSARLTNFHDMFDINFSYNFIPFKTIIIDFENKRLADEPLGEFQLDAEFFLVLQNEGGLRTILLNKAEAGFFLKNITTQAEGDLQIALYDINVGILKSSSKNFNDRYLQNSSAFNNQLCQIKFFNAELNYTEKESEELLKWIQEKGLDRVKALLSIILSKNETARQAFPTSDLARIMNLAASEAQERI